MKLANALVVFSCMGLMSLTGCGGVEEAQAAEEVSLGSMEQALCAEPALPAGCTTMLYPYNTYTRCYTASYADIPYMCSTTDGKCKWYGCNGPAGNWGTYSGTCAQFQANFCH
jgi:hypothetical protein